MMEGSGFVAIRNIALFIISISLLKPCVATTIMRLSNDNNAKCQRMRVMDVYNFKLIKLTSLVHLSASEMLYFYDL